MARRVASLLAALPQEQLLSFWNTREDAQRYDRDWYSKVKEILEPLLQTAPTVQTVEVNISTTDKILTKIAVGKAA